MERTQLATGTDLEIWDIAAGATSLLRGGGPG
jgi:hypothetical protein